VSVGLMPLGTAVTGLAAHEFGLRPTPARDERGGRDGRRWDRSPYGLYERWGAAPLSRSRPRPAAPA
jgi:hypothetical protein